MVHTMLHFLQILMNVKLRCLVLRVVRVLIQWAVITVRVLLDGPEHTVKKVRLSRQLMPFIPYRTHHLCEWVDGCVGGYLGCVEVCVRFMLCRNNSMSFLFSNTFILPELLTLRVVSTVASLWSRATLLT